MSEEVGFSAHLGGTLFDNTTYIYIIGGEKTLSGSSSKTVLSFNLVEGDAKTWTALPDLPVAIVRNAVVAL